MTDPEEKIRDLLLELHDRVEQIERLTMQADTMAEAIIGSDADLYAHAAAVARCRIAQRAFEDARAKLPHDFDGMFGEVL